MAQLMPVRFNKHVLFNPYINYGYYLSPSFMPMMLLIFIVMVTVFTIGTELRRVRRANGSRRATARYRPHCWGKVLPVTVVMFLMSLVMFLIIFKVVGVPLNGSLTVILLSTLLVRDDAISLAVFIVSLLSNLRLSLSIGGGYSVLAFTFSGLTFRSWPCGPPCST